MDLIIHGEHLKTATADRMGKAPIRVGLPEGMRKAAQVATVTGAGVRTPPGARLLEATMQPHIAAEQHKATLPNGNHVPVYRVIVRDPTDRTVEWVHRTRFEGERGRAERLAERIKESVEKDEFSRDHVEISDVWHEVKRKTKRTPAEEYELRCRIEQMMAQLD